MKIDDLHTPAVLVENNKLEANITRMQSACDRAGVELWPHIKTHKLPPVLRRQLDHGAKGATCAKVGEAEAMLSSGVRRIFIAHSLVHKHHAPRLKKLQGALDELILAVTSEAQCHALEELLEEADLKVPVLLGVNTGLGREGVRTLEEAKALGARIRASSRMELRGIYTHEGHAYKTAPEQIEALVENVHEQLLRYREAIGGDLPLWPGCSVTALSMVGREGVKVVRPGSYVFSDLSLILTTKVLPEDSPALTVLTTVIDKPEPGLVLIDAGTKVLSSDHTPKGLHGRDLTRPSIQLTRVTEEHGFLTGEGVDDLRIGERLRLIPAHVCSVPNLASRVYLVDGNSVIDTWTVEGRGRSD